jgi:hypothetical protein
MTYLRDKAFGLSSGLQLTLSRPTLLLDADLHVSIRTPRTPYAYQSAR